MNLTCGRARIKHDPFLSKSWKKVQKIVSDKVQIEIRKKSAKSCARILPVEEHTRNTELFWVNRKKKVQNIVSDRVQIEVEEKKIGQN